MRIAWATGMNHYEPGGKPLCHPNWGLQSGNQWDWVFLVAKTGSVVNQGESEKRITL